jgi:hypothetical protein
LHNRLAGLVEKSFPAIARDDAYDELDIIPIAGPKVGQKLPAQGLRKSREAVRQQPAAAKLEHPVPADKPLSDRADGVVRDVGKRLFETVERRGDLFVPLVVVFTRSSVFQSRAEILVEEESGRRY